MKAAVNGIQIKYELSGKEDGPVVVLSHSLGSSMEMWNPQMDLLAQSYRILRFDTRGHGGSDAPEGPYTLEMLAEDTVGLLDALKIDRVHWVGLSMGGMIAQAMALDYPVKLKSLVLCDTAAVMGQDVQPVWQERIDAARQKGMSALVEQTLERWLTAAYLGKNTPETDLIRNHFLSTPVPGFIGCSEAIRKLDYLNRLSGITLPTLVIVGEEDPGTPVSAAEAIHERIAGSKLVVLPNAAHLSNIEQAEAFNRALLEFLSEQS